MRHLLLLSCIHLFSSYSLSGANTCVVLYMRQWRNTFMPWTQKSWDGHCARGFWDISALRLYWPLPCLYFPQVYLFCGCLLWTEGGWFLSSPMCMSFQSPVWALWPSVWIHCHTGSIYPLWTAHPPAPFSAYESMLFGSSTRQIN